MARARHNPGIMDTSFEPESVDAQCLAIECALRKSDLDVARAAIGRAQALAASRHDRARVMFWRARFSYVSGELEVALSLALEASSGVAALADSGLEASIRALLSRCLLGAGDSQGALDQALAAVRLVEADNPAEAGPLLKPRQAAETTLGVVYLALQDLESAQECCQRGVECARALGDQVALGAAIDTLACVYGAFAARERAQGHSALADEWDRKGIRCSAEAVRIASAEGHREYEATALNNQCEALALVGDAAQALDLLDEWAQRNPSPLPHVQAHHLDTRGSIWLALGHPTEARNWFEQALQHVEAKVSRMMMTGHLACALEHCGDWQAALGQYKRFHELHVQINAEKAQRSARIAAVRLDVERAHARSEALARRNEHLQRRAEDLQRLSSEDALTGLPNRRRLEELLRGDPKGLCVAMIDVDHFKLVNDQYSHAIGDEVLRRLAGLLREGCREADTPARLGGEEFVALLRTAEPLAAQAAAERLRLLIARHDWNVVAAGLSITVSIGVACSGEADDGAALLDLADRRLYAAKRGGRNRVVFRDTCA